MCCECYTFANITNLFTICPCQLETIKPDNKWTAGLKTEKTEIAFACRGSSREPNREINQSIQPAKRSRVRSVSPPLRQDQFQTSSFSYIASSLPKSVERSAFLRQACLVTQTNIKTEGGFLLEILNASVTIKAAVPSFSSLLRRSSVFFILLRDKTRLPQKIGLPDPFMKGLLTVSAFL